MSLSTKVTPELLDRMYNNFVKITDWLIKGKDSKYPLPPAVKQAVEAVEQNSNDVAELQQLVSTMQARMAQQDTEIGHLKGLLNGVNGHLEQILSGQSNQVAVDMAQDKIAQEPAPAPVEVTDELTDLDDYDTPAEPVQEKAKPKQSPKEQAVQLSAKAIDAGDIDPASFEALDAEVANLLVQ